MRKVQCNSSRLISFTKNSPVSVILFHGGVEAITMQLMHVMLSLLETVAHQDTFAGVVHLEHMLLGLGFRPTENLLENVRHVIHEIYGIVPANNNVTRFVTLSGFLLRSLRGQDQ